MKRFQYFALLMTFTSTLMVIAGCGSGSSAPPLSTTNSGLISGVGTLPNGGAMVNFTGINVYNDQTAIFAGGTVTGGNSGSANFCGSFYFGQTCWDFSNPRNPNGSGQLTIGGTGAGINPTSINSFGYGYPLAANAFRDYSKFDSGSMIVIVQTGTGNDVLHENVTGSLILSPTFIQAHFGGTMPTVTGIAFDFATDLSGGVVLYTPVDPSGVKGFLAF